MSQALKLYQEMMGDMETLVTTYPEGIDVPALRDWFGIEAWQAQLIMDRAHKGGVVDILRFSARRGVRRVIWPKGAPPPLARLSNGGARMIRVMEDMARAAGTYPDVSASFADLSALQASAPSSALTRVIDGLVDVGALSILDRRKGHKGRYRLIRPAAQINPRLVRKPRQKAG